MFLNLLCLLYIISIYNGFCLLKSYSLLLEEKDLLCLSLYREKKEKERKLFLEVR